MESDTTSDRRPFGKMSVHADPASSKTCRSNSAKCCRGFSSRDWKGRIGEVIITTVESDTSGETEINFTNVVINLWMRKVFWNLINVE